MLDVFDDLTDSIVTMWSLWEDAFSSEAEGVLPESMHEVGREFFEYSRWAMLNYVILALCRLGSDGDSSPAGQGSRRANLTVNRVLSEAEFGAREDLRAAATRFAEEFVSLVGDRLKLLRNRLISHNDLATITGEGVFPDVGIPEVRRGVHCLLRFHDAIRAVRQGSTLAPSVAWGPEIPRRANESVRELLGALKAEVKRRYSDDA